MLACTPTHTLHPQRSNHDHFQNFDGKALAAKSKGLSSITFTVVTNLMEVTCNFVEARRGRRRRRTHNSAFVEWACVSRLCVVRQRPAPLLCATATRGRWGRIHAVNRQELGGMQKVFHLQISHWGLALARGRTGDPAPNPGSQCATKEATRSLII